MKKIILILSLCCLIFNSGAIFGVDIFLESPMLDFIDGKSFGMNAKSFGVVLQNRREIRKRLLGALAKSGKRIGMYSFEGQSYSLIELAKIEDEIDAQYEKANGELKKEYKKRINELKKVLEEAKEDFIAFTKGYIEAICGIKEALLVLIEEFCEKKGLDRCLLLEWGSVPAGSEEDFIRSKCDTFKKFAKFCQDLTSFMEVIARSCPKAKAQFVAMVRKAKKG